MRLIRLVLLLTLFFLMTAPAFSQKPELYVQTGHSHGLNAIAFSPDGKTLASCGDDRAIKLWDVATGLELRTLTGHSDSVYSITFTPASNTLISGSTDGTVKFWQVDSGQSTKTLEGHLTAVSIDGNTIAIEGNDSEGDGSNNIIRVWDVKSGKELRAINDHSSNFWSAAFSPDGKVLATGSSNTVQLWDIKSGRALGTIRVRSDPEPEGGDDVFSIAFSLDGKLLATANRFNKITLIDVNSGQPPRTLAMDERVILRIGHHLSFAFSIDGRMLASSPDQRHVFVWDTVSGRILRTLKGDGLVRAVAFSPETNILAGATANNTITLWDAASGSELRTLNGRSSKITSVAFSPIGMSLASSSNRTIKLWNAAHGQELRTLTGQAFDVLSIAFSHDGKTLASGSADGTIKLLDVASARELLTIKDPSTGVTSLAFSSDGKVLASGVKGGAIKLWDTVRGQELRSINDDSYYSLALSPDGRTLAGASRSTIKLWDVGSGRELRSIKSRFLQSVAISRDGKTIAAGLGDIAVLTFGPGGLIRTKVRLKDYTEDTVKLWDVTSGIELRTFSGHSKSVNSVAFSPDGKSLASGSDDNTVKVWDVASGRGLHTLEGHSSSVTSVAFSPDGSTLATGGEDGKTNLWDVQRGKNLASLIAIDGKDWIVATPEGLFDGSPPAWNSILWRFNNNTFNYSPVESFFSDFYYPGLLSDIFAGKHPQAPSDISQKDRRQALVKLTLADAQPNSTVTTRNAGVKVDVSQAPAGAQDVRLFRNGSLVKLWRGNVMQDKNSVTLEASIPIVAGENRLTAYAFNHDNIKSSDATLTVTGLDNLKRTGVAYVLAIGVNEYANSQYNLKYAVADAQDIAAELKRQQARLNNYSRVEVISLNDKDASKANILKSLTDLSAKVQPEDALVIFFAGHGTAQQNRFYLIPHDLGYAGDRTTLDSAGLQNILAHSISDEEVSRAVEWIDAGQMLLVIDACNSGQALEAEEKRRGPMNSKGLAQLAYEKGMYILTAAQSYQAANEAERYGHGFLTYALVEEGLKTSAADKQPKDGQVLLREWLDFATERVPQMQQDKLDEQKKQGRQLDRIKFAEADSGGERSIQRPRVFYRRETETHPLVVARP